MSRTPASFKQIDVERTAYCTSRTQRVFSYPEGA